MRCVPALTCGLLTAALLITATPARAQVRAELAASGFSSPLGFVQDPSDRTVQVVLEKGGRVRALKNWVVQAEDFLTLEVATAGEQGLLGLAFAPDYATSGRLFVNFIDPQGRTVVARFTRAAGNPLRADPASRTNLVWPDGQPFIEKPFANHHGGHLAFGPDGYLYVGLGDGGSSDDPLHLAQDPTSLLGKMLRIDVAVADGDPEGYDVPPTNPFVGQGGILPEIWALGLRNPWRWSFDDPARGGSGGLVIADVGQGGWEEINFEPAGAGGRNYGWRNREGAHDNVVDLPPLFAPLIDPILEYSHADGQSITGGLVYRGALLGDGYRGRYFFGDFVTSRVWSIGIHTGSDPAVAFDMREHSNELAAGARLPSSFGVDADGELYIVNYFSGSIHRIALAPVGPPPAPAPSGCPGTDPFAEIGGGTCAAGNWYPPGFPIPTPTAPPAPQPPAPGVPPVTSCATPDPFAILGGGTCAGGNWYPPGFPVPPDVPVAPAPTPTPQPPAPPTPGVPPATTCATPDPFAILGGGTCAAGNWYPPGITPPSQAPNPPTNPPPTTPPTAPTPTTPTTCGTPDPFAILGGGTCANGGWYPPGMTPPTAATPPSAPVTVPGGCTSPDPFVILGGGKCIAGNWYPPGGP